MPGSRRVCYRRDGAARRARRPYAAEAGILKEMHRRLGLAGLRLALQRRDDRGVNTLGCLLSDPQARRVGGQMEIDAPAPGWTDITFHKRVTLD